MSKSCFANLRILKIDLHLTLIFSVVTCFPKRSKKKILKKKWKYKIGFAPYNTNITISQKLKVQRWELCFLHISVIWGDRSMQSEEKRDDAKQAHFEQVERGIRSGARAVNLILLNKSITAQQCASAYSFFNSHTCFDLWSLFPLLCICACCMVLLSCSSI